MPKVLVSTYVESHVHEELKQHAAKLDRSVSWCVGKAIERLLEEAKEKT